MAARGRGRLGAAHHGARGNKAPGRGKTGTSRTSRVANAEVGAEFNPGIRSTAQEVEGSRKREADLGSWYAQLAADYQGAQAAGAAALGSVEATSTQQQKEAAERSGLDQAALASEDESLATLVGGPKDTAGLAKIAAAGAAAERGRVAQAKPIASEQANFVAQLGADATAAQLGGIEARTTEASRRDTLKSNLAAQRREKGGARIAAEEKIAETTRTAALEEAKLKLAEREAGTSEQAAAAAQALAQLKSNHEEREDTIANRQAQERIGVSKTNAKISSANAKTSRRSARATAKHYEKENSGGLTTAEKRSRGEHAADAMAAAKALLGIKVPKSPKQWAQFEAALIEKLGSSYAAQAADAVSKLKNVQASKGRRGYDKRVRKGSVAGPPTPR